MSRNGLRVFAIREARAYPWIISTSRHISQGGVDLLDVKWSDRDKTLSGRSSAVKDDPYVMTIHLPEGFRLKVAKVDNEQVKTPPGEKAVRGVPGHGHLFGAARSQSKRTM